MYCPRCQLPDLYHGQGDGIGTCDCPRCSCCHAGPDGCSCRQDWDCDEDWDGDEAEPIDDYLCNDPTCPTRAARTAARATATRKD